MHETTASGSDQYSQTSNRALTPSVNLVAGILIALYENELTQTDRDNKSKTHLHESELAKKAISIVRENSSIISRFDEDLFHLVDDCFVEALPYRRFRLTSIGRELAIMVARRAGGIITSTE